MLHVCLFLCNLSFAADGEPPTPAEIQKMLYDQMRHGDEGPSVADRISIPDADPRKNPGPIQFPERPPQQLTAGTVSAQRLAHKVPKAAKKALEEADALVKKGRYAAAVALLEKALAIDPEFAEAHNDLGMRYMAVGKGPEGEQEFRKAIALDPAFVGARANLATYEFATGDLGSAEKEARNVLTLAPTDRRARQLLDLIAARQIPK